MFPSGKLDIGAAGKWRFVLVFGYWVFLNENHLGFHMRLLQNLEKALSELICTQLNTIVSNLKTIWWFEKVKASRDAPVW